MMNSEQNSFKNNDEPTVFMANLTENQNKNTLIDFEQKPNHSEFQQLKEHQNEQKKPRMNRKRTADTKRRSISQHSPARKQARKQSATMKRNQKSKTTEMKKNHDKKHANNHQSHIKKVTDHQLNNKTESQQQEFTLNLGHCDASTQTDFN